MVKTRTGTRVLEILMVASMILGSTSLMSNQWLYAAPKTETKVEAAVSKMVNINKATLEELQTVRGIGPALAERVILYRDEHGHFERPEDLVNVRGIGEAKFQKIRSQISI